ncbi:MAG: hypothetical protein R6V49_09155 [Bacteroidales bacterium]
MMKFSLILLLANFLLSPFFALTQPLQKYQGKLQNGYTDAGDVAYSYRSDPKSHEHVKQGTFRYTVKAKDDQYRFNHNIAGNYSNNLKDGLWSYKINQKDFQLQDPKRYTTGTVSLDAQYSKGIPDGKWRYESALKSRTGEKKQDKWVWDRHDSLETVIIDLHYKQGTLVGPFYAKLDKSYEVNGSFDENGFFDGEWIWRYPDSVIAIQWDKGLELGMTISDPEGNILHMDQQNHSAGLIREYQELTSAGSDNVKEFPFSIDTISMLNRSSYPLTELLHNTLYNPNYFLYRQIDGDKSIFYDSQSYRMRFSIRGMNLIQIRNRISTMQVQHYSRIDAVMRRIEAQMAYIYQMKREGKLTIQAGEAIRLMEHNITLARRYGCIAETLKLYLNLQDGLNAAEASCAYLPASIGKLPGFKTKEEALQFFATKISDVEKENQTQYTNIRKNMIQK